MNSESSAYTVFLHGEHVGILQHRGRYTKFVFDEDYWNRSKRPVLGQWFENHPRRQPSATNQVPQWFSNLLPEGRLRELVAREQGVSIYNEMALLGRIGRDLPGAVEVVPDPDITANIDVADVIHIPDPLESTPRFPVRASLAGMTMKFSVCRQGDRLVLPAHGESGDVILKTPDGHYPNLPVNEFAVMKLAGSIGIEVPDVKLYRRDQIDDLGDGAWVSDEEVAYTIMRFDRTDNGRVHIEDFAQVLGRFGMSESKYKSNVETVAGLAFRGYDHDSLQETIRRIVFNLLVGNGDAHLKNWSLIYPDRKTAKLSPAYDLVSTATYPNHAELGLPFFGDERLEQISRSHFKRLQEKLQVGSADILDILDVTLENFFDVWPSMREEMPADVARWIDGHASHTRTQLTG